MTDTGQVPGEGQPESAGMVEQPGVAAPGAYTYLSETPVEDDELLLPGAQGAWGNEVPPPAPEPVVQVVHEPGPHETSGRDSGSIDLGAVRHPVATAVPQPPVARRPLHLGPPTPDASASPVRSLADRGPAGAPVPPSAVRPPGPPTTGPEYLDVPPQGVTPWGTPAPAAATTQPAPVAQGHAAETVVPQEAQPGAVVAETPQMTESPQVTEVEQDAEALHDAQDAAYAQAQEAAVAQFATGQVHVAEAVAQATAPQPTEVPVVPELAEVQPVAEATEAQPVEVVAVPQGAEAQPAGEAGEVAAVQPVTESAEAQPVVEAAEVQVVAETQPVVEESPAAEAETGAPAADAQAVAEHAAPDAQPAAEPAADAPQSPEPAESASDAQAPEDIAAVAPGAAEPAAAGTPTESALDALVAREAQVPESTSFPPAAEGPEPIQAQVPADAQDVSPVPQQNEDAAQPVDAPAPVQAESGAAAPEAVPGDAAEPVAETSAPETAPVAAEAQAAPAAPVDETAAPTAEGEQPAAEASAEQTAGEAPLAEDAQPLPDAANAQDTEQPAEPQEGQEPQAAETPAPETEQPQPAGTAEPVAAEAAAAPAEPQPDELSAAEPAQTEPQAAVAEETATEQAAAQEAAAEEALTSEPGQSEPESEHPQSPAQGPQGTEPVALAADAAEQAPETAAPPSQTEAEAADVTVEAQEADQPGEAVPTEPVAVEEAPAEEPPADESAVAQPAEPVATAEAPAQPAEPVAAGAVAADASAAVTPSPLDAPQGAVLQPSAGAPADAPHAADAAQEPGTEQPMGGFVPVDGSVPTTPHLAPTPPQGMVVPPLPADDRAAPATAAAPGETADEAPEQEPQAEPVATVPAPRDSEAETIVVPQSVAAAAEERPDVVQNAEDLDTRAADQEDGEEAEAVEAADESVAAVDEASEEAEVRQPAGPAAPPYDDAEREAVLKVMRERRDIRNGFRSDPIPHDVLLRVLEAAHTAPSVGHSQPWDFVVIRSAETRRTMHELAQRQREAYAKSLPKGRAKQFKELKIEAILDTPVNIVVTADPTRGGRHTLGRHTQPQMAPYSSALAVENLWLAARAEGLGVGWVSFFDEREMVRALGLPEHLEVVAYLCVGYVDEFPAEPELMQAGWAKRRPLSWVVHEETYGRRALPGAEPHDLLAETVAGIRPLDAKALGEAWERQKRMTKPAGALGMLEIISAQLSGLSRQCPPPIPEPAAVAIFAGDHGVHAQGVTPWPQEVTGQMVANFLGGGAVCNAFANQVGAEVCVVDVGVASDLPATPGLLPRKVRAGTSDMTTGPAMTREEAKKAIEVGIETARDLVAAGNKALLTGEMGIANTTASAALISVFTGADPAEVTGRGTGINDETLARKTEVVRRAIELHQPDPADPIGVLAAIGGFEHAAIVGLLLGGASLRTPVILDGVSAGAAALVARAIAPEVLAACIAGHRSAEPGHVAALKKLGLRPLVDLDLRLGEGTGALLALPVVQSAARAMHEVATFDSAGVTEK
ncbi:nicotinate-nucleotide--dimethylbenzimidazole phosphoribosyltransferase [Streptomyces sp. NPDC101112]|uniref:nicotinate-nucleotide--dimethylbenzimidazole phosphoribosyltransferase n=1 Tax=Streptomyces sp. NPDC101112 TaxID=3366105 RepID=UPI0038133319